MPPAWQKRIHGWMTVWWIVLIPLSHFTGWVESNTFISDLSMVALVLGSVSSWQASRVEVKQDDAAATTAE